MAKNKWSWMIAVALVLVIICSAGLFKNVSADNNPTEHPTEGILVMDHEATRYGTGTCGENLTWSLDEEGVLTIEGTGAMDDYDAADAPWMEQADEVQKVLIISGVTRIGSCAFEACAKLTEVIFVGDAPQFADNAFAGVAATVFYPNENDTWTSEVMQNYGGSITWIEN